MEDRALIEQYAQHGSERAFAEFTQRYEGFVFSTALRKVQDADLARDVVQKVFLSVARKAGALCREPILAGWLGRATQLEALKLLRERRRRTHREQVFLSDVNGAKSSVDSSDLLSERVQSALQRLSEQDRRAVHLRFSEGKSLKETAVALCIGEDAAQKRIARALDKMRATLSKDGFASAQLIPLLGLPAFSTSAAGASAAVTMGASAPSAAGTTAFGSITSLLAMAKLKVLTITCAVAAITVTPLAIQYLQEPESGVSAAKTVSSAPKQTMPAVNDEASAARAEADALRAEMARLRDELVAAKTTAPDVQTEAPEPDSVATLKQRALNPQNDPDTRLQALRGLRDRNARDAQVAAAMAVFARSTNDPQIRADIFRQLSGMRDPSLKPVLLEALKGDASEEVRQEAAETLGAYSGDADVAGLLQSVSRTDADTEVRAHAAEALAKSAPVEELRRMQSDPESTDLEIYHSISALRKREGADPAHVVPLLNVLKETKIPDLRKEIVEDLGKHYGNIPEVAEWMDHLAQIEEDPKVRREAAKFSSDRPK